MKSKQPSPVKLFVGMITGVPPLVDSTLRALEERYGPVDARSAELPFVFTTYYDDEMGPGLKRIFLGFRDLIDPGDLASIKRHTNAIEEAAASNGGVPPRPINLDPGYITPAKLVLATAKDYSHRVYLEQGIYAEVTLMYQDGDFQPMPWTYPDYRTESYKQFFRELRGIYMAQVSASPGRRPRGTSSR